MSCSQLFFNNKASGFFQGPLDKLENRRESLGRLPERIQIGLLEMFSQFDRLTDRPAGLLLGKSVDFRPDGGQRLGNRQGFFQQVVALGNGIDQASLPGVLAHADTIVTPSLAAQLAEAPSDLRTFVEIAAERVLGASEHVETERGQALVCDVVTFIEQRGSGYAWPGNVRELEQCVRCFLVRRDYPRLSARPASPTSPTEHSCDLDTCLAGLELTASELLDRYCAAQYQHLGTITAVARTLALHHRTVRTRITAARNGP
jgi:hypothetical protein